MEPKIDEVEVVSVGEPNNRDLKMLTLRVTKAVDATRVGSEVKLLVPRAYTVGPGDHGTALWMPGSHLPKLILTPAAKREDA